MLRLTTELATQTLIAERAAIRGPAPEVPTASAAAPPAAAPEPAGRAVAPPPSLRRALPQPATPRPGHAAEASWPQLPAAEVAVQQTFKAAYDVIDETVADISLPCPTDRSGVLRADGDGGPQPSVDVVVCVHNALDDVRCCLWSLVQKSTYPFHLVVVNDGSDETTTNFLRRFAADHPAVTLVENLHPPHGYTIAANLGVRSTSADYVVLLNSDTIVTLGWLERIVTRGEADPSAGILGPLSNAASHQSVPELRDADGWSTNPLPDWLTPDGVALAAARAGLHPDARLPFINGFCFVVKRAVFEVVGDFDEEHFASGYCEENDFAYRARLAGFTTAVVDDAYVFHAKSKSFGVAGRKPLAKRNYEIFLEKHGPENIEELVRTMEADPALRPVREAIAQSISSPEAFAQTIDSGASRPLTIVYILPGLSDGGSGGAHSIYQEVHGLRALGVPARIALWHKAMPRARSVYADADEIFQTFASDEQLERMTRDADVISATHNTSVAMLAAIRRTRTDFLPAYYVQDYEPLFTQADPRRVDEAITSYTAIDGMLLFAKTHWLCNLVGERHGLYVAKVEPSIDADVYYPSAEENTADALRVTAMIRPRTPRRQPFSTVHVLERLLEDFPGQVQVRTFGCNADALAKVTRSSQIAASNRGVLPRDDVADLLRDTDVFLDMSMYQAFGRTALEAMACGATAIVPRIGGAWEFARHGENALMVDTLSREDAYAQLAGLVKDRTRVDELRAAARVTAQRYSTTRAALSEYVVFEHAYRQRFGRPDQRLGSHPRDDEPVRPK